MIKNYLLLAFRNMKRQPAVTFINVIGLAFGMAATIIALPGLYGLSSYMVQSRRREVSLRKVLGATLVQIMMVFFKVILKLVLIAIVIA